MKKLILCSSLMIAGTFAMADQWARATNIGNDGGQWVGNMFVNTCYYSIDVGGQRFSIRVPDSGCPTYIEYNPFSREWRPA